MTSEGGVLQCGSCGEQLTYGAADTVVTCPHCGTVLAVPHETSSESPMTFPGEPIEEPVTSFPGLPGNDVAAGESAIAAFSAGQPPETEPKAVVETAATETVTETPPDVGDDATAESPSAITKGFLNWAADSDSSGDEPSGIPNIITEETPVEHAVGEMPSFDAQPEKEDVQDESTPTSPKATPKTAGETPRRPGPPAGGVPRHLFILLAGYASAVTIALIWLWITRGRTHPLESLPDVIPKQDAEGKTAYPFPADDDPMPFGHTLNFGETRRFGNLEITPLRVTRGPLQLVDSGELDEADYGDGVFKLWLKIRNVSDDQTFKPFGRELLQLRSRDKRVNTFVARDDDRTKTRVPMWSYQLDATGYALKDQQLDRKLGPGEEYETYLASDYGTDALTGSLVWRVHFRKGYNPKSKRGVTTLFEVLFHRDDVKQETIGG